MGSTLEGVPPSRVVAESLDRLILSISLLVDSGFGLTPELAKDALKVMESIRDYAGGLADAIEEDVQVLQAEPLLTLVRMPADKTLLHVVEGGAS